MLASWVFSVAGESDRDDLNSLTIQPFGGFGFSDGWSLNTSEMTFNYNFKTDKWTSLPLGLRVEKLVTIGKLPARVFVDFEHNFADQAFYLSEATAMGRDSAQKMIQAGQVETLDVAMFLEYTRALSQKNHNLANFLYQRFRLN